MSEIKNYREALLNSGAHITKATPRDGFYVCALPRECDHGEHD